MNSLNSFPVQTKFQFPKWSLGLIVVLPTKEENYYVLERQKLNTLMPYLEYFINKKHRNK